MLASKKMWLTAQPCQEALPLGGSHLILLGEHAEIFFGVVPNGRLKAKGDAAILISLDGKQVALLQTGRFSHVIRESDLAFFANLRHRVYAPGYI